jgi:hypothetical protein
VVEGSSVVSNDVELSFNTAVGTAPFERVEAEPTTSDWSLHPPFETTVRVLKPPFETMGEFIFYFLFSGQWSATHKFAMAHTTQLLTYHAPLLILTCLREFRIPIITLLI